MQWRMRVVPCPAAQNRVWAPFNPPLHTTTPHWQFLFVSSLRTARATLTARHNCSLACAWVRTARKRLKHGYACGFSPINVLYAAAFEVEPHRYAPVLPGPPPLGGPAVPIFAMNRPAGLPRWAVHRGCCRAFGVEPAACTASARGPVTPPYTTASTFPPWDDAERHAATAAADAAAAARIATLPPAEVAVKAAACLNLERALKEQRNDPNFWTRTRP